MYICTCNRKCGLLITGNRDNSDTPVPSAMCAYSRARTRKFVNSPRLRIKHFLVSGLGIYCPLPEIDGYLISISALFTIVGIYPYQAEVWSCTPYFGTARINISYKHWRTRGWLMMIEASKFRTETPTGRLSGFLLDTFRRVCKGIAQSDYP